MILWHMLIMSHGLDLVYEGGFSASAVHTGWHQSNFFLFRICMSEGQFTLCLYLLFDKMIFWIHNQMLTCLV